MTPEQEQAFKNRDVYHVPLWAGDYQGFLHQSTLLDVFKHVEYAEHEKNRIWDLPGHGKSYFDCGQIQFKGCDHVENHDHGKVFGRWFKRNCRRKSCPKCFEGWASAEAERALIRMASFASGSREVERLIKWHKVEMVKNPKSKAKFHRDLVVDLEKLANPKSFRAIHVVLSPSKVDCKKAKRYDGYLDLRKVAYEIAKNHGLYGGSMIVHPYRLRCSRCHSRIFDYQKSCRKCHGSKFEWFFSPHFHIVGYGWIRNVKSGFSKHGWIVKNLRVRKSVFATFQYLLSHAGVSRFHTTTWFGKLSYARMHHVPKLGRVLEVCPYCSGLLHPLVWIGSVDRPPPLEIFCFEDPLENDFLVDKSEFVCV
jgi:hypothetical protein